MPIVININSGKDFEPVSEGVHSAVLADIVDKGVVQTAFGPKHKVMFLWLTDEADEGGQTKYVFQSFTASLHEKAGLRKAVKAIRGRDIEGENFDVETLLGSQAQLVIQHNEGQDGKVYANVQAILKPKGPKVEIPADFTRKKDKPQDGNGKSGGGMAAAKAVLKPAVRAAQPTTITDEDIPF